MATSVVVATIVNTKMSEAGFRQQVGEQLQLNDQRLLDRLAAADGEAEVVTAVLNVDKLLAYLIRRFPHAVDAAISTRTQPADGAAAGEPTDAHADLRALSEGEFMDLMLAQIEAGEIEPKVRFPAEYWEEDEAIGEDYARYPFLY